MTMRSLATASIVVVAAALSGCNSIHPATDATTAAPREVAASRRQLDQAMQVWCTDRKGLPETPAVCSCIADQLHIQSLSDDGARDLVEVLYAVGPGSDPPFERLEAGNRQRLDRAAELCGARLP